MLHEKPNESFHWKNKLDELDHLPGDAATDKTASWKKLHDRLGDKPTYRKALWYWLAAACILIAVGIKWIDTNQKQDKIVRGKKQIKPEQVINRPEMVMKESTVVIPPAPPLKREKRQEAVTSSRNRTHNASKNAAITPTPGDEHNAISQGFLPETIVQTNDSPDTAVTKATATLAVKKKLRVIHINELEKPADETTQYAKTIIPAKSVDRDGLSAFSLTKNTSDNIVKIKLSPSN